MNRAPRTCGLVDELSVAIKHPAESKKKKGVRAVKIESAVMRAISGAAVRRVFQGVPIKIRI